MTDLTIEQEIVIDAPVDVVWRTITEPDQITQWFADRVELDLRPGGEGTFGFDQGDDGTPVRQGLLVEAVEPPHRFAFRWGQPEGVEPTPATAMLVEFTLVAEGAERTRLRVAETGFDSVTWSDDEKARYAEDHRGGWAHHLGRLVDRYAPTAG